MVADLDGVRGPERVKDAEKIRLVGRALVLVAEEEGLRAEARALELVPGNREEADRLFRRASDKRAERLGLLERCGLL